MNRRPFGWKTKFLNMTDRIFLAKATLSSVSSHVMQYIRLPSKVTKSINKIQRDFIWESITKKKNGGLGLQRSDLKNKALLAGLAWRDYKSSNSILSSVLNYKRLPRNHTNSARKVVIKTWKNIQDGWKDCGDG